MIGSRPAYRLAAGAVGVFLAAGLLAASQAAAEDLARGQKIWAAKAGCPGCHGWAGDGVGAFHSQGRAPALRATELTRDQIRETIQCGRPGTPMPHFDRFAYTDKRCYGLSADDLGSDTPNRSPTTLQPDEIDALADYVAVKLKGGGHVTRAQCLEYFGNSTSHCSEYPEH